MGGYKCVHDKWKQYCRECSPQSFCEHGRNKHMCGLCGGKGAYREHLYSAGKRRALTNELTRDRYYWLIARPCVYCGKPSGGVDRVKNTHGYTTFNSVPCCLACNGMKSSRPAPDFLGYARDIVVHTPTYDTFKTRWIETRTSGPDLTVNK